MLKTFESLYLPAVFVLILYPILMVLFAVFYILKFNFGAFEITCFVCTYYVCSISVGVGLHRYWSHNSFKLNKVVEFILAVFSAATLQGPILVWASDHAKHHAFTDTELDPHSPKKFKNSFKGFLWSHIGWMLFRRSPSASIHKPTFVRLNRKNFVMWQMKYYWQIAIFMNLFFPFAIGYFIMSNSLTYGFSAVIFCGLARFAQQQVTFLINSVTHFFGKKTYYDGSAGDIWWLFPVLGGENWHNFHHAFPSDYRNGSMWYHFDLHKWVIYLLYLLGLAKEMKVTPFFRLESKKEEFLENNFSMIKQKWLDIVNNFCNTQVSIDNFSPKDLSELLINNTKLFVHSLRSKVIKNNNLLLKTYSQINVNSFSKTLSYSKCCKLFKNLRKALFEIEKSLILSN